MNTIEFKKKGLFLLLLAAASVTKAQTSMLAPIGAEWYYETSKMFSSGYIRMIVERDTIIDNNNCIKILREKQWYDKELDETYSVALSPVFLSQNGNSVMFYDNEQFYKLYDFGANIGDSLLILGMPDFCASNVCKVFITDKGSETIGGVSLRYIDVKDAEDSDWGWSGTIAGGGQEIPIIRIYERIGAVGSYFFPEQRCTFDYSEGGIFRCYEDDEIGHLNYSFPLVECDFIGHNTALDENKDKECVKVFPNPCQETIYVNIEKMDDDNCIIELYDVCGNRVYSNNVEENLLEINVESFAKGLYVLKLTTRENRIYNLIIKK